MASTIVSEGKRCIFGGENMANGKNHSSRDVQLFRPQHCQFCEIMP
ncbi:MAG: hypothetical protein MGG11_17660 [Trichodesmium sp. MAG_R03]|nr:hypothetical protein [Trichodesmium sp. MAG_R03]MCL2933999.1 hypothetical protein [Trichodesmium sp. MAG_R03]